MSLKQSYLLDPQIIFLNHGSFGAVPKPVFYAYQHWQRHIERQPVAFFQREANRLLLAARTELGAYLNADPQDLVFVTNATTGINIIARSLGLSRQDAILTTNAEYGALDRTWRFLSEKKGFQIIRHPLMLPLTTPESFADAFLQSLRTDIKLVYLSHILSSLSAILPVQAICRRCRELGILTIIDGAHAPGHLPLDLRSIGADFYVGNLHKWLSAPRGAGFIYARPEVQDLIEPLVVSWGWDSVSPGESRFIDLLQYSGTRDLSAFLSVPAAIRFQKEHHWKEIQTECHRLAGRALSSLTDARGLQPFYQAKSDWFGQMVSIPLPKNTDVEFLHDRLLQEEGIEVVTLVWEGRPILRVSVQSYNTENEINKLIKAVSKRISTGR
jgi:isopenicillin-N epimerase